MMISRKLEGMKRDSLLLRATYIGIWGILFKTSRLVDHVLWLKNGTMY